MLRQPIEPIDLPADHKWNTCKYCGIDIFNYPEEDRWFHADTANTNCRPTFVATPKD